MSFEIRERHLDPLIDNYIVPGIKKLIEDQVRAIIEKASEDARRQVQAALPKVLAEVGIQVSRTIQIDRFGDTIRIELSLKDKT